LTKAREPSIYSPARRWKGLDVNRVLEILVGTNRLSPSEAKKVEESISGGETVMETLARLGFLSEEETAQVLAKAHGLTLYHIDKDKLDPSLCRFIPLEYAKKHLVVPIWRKGKRLGVAVADPGDPDLREDLTFMTGHSIELFVSTVSEIKEAIESLYGVEEEDSEGLSKIVETLEEDLEVIEEEEEEPDVSELSHLIEEAPVVKLVNGIIAEAVRQKASDIHIEPYEKRVRVRFRIDGVLQEAIPIPYKLKDAVVSRIKVMAKLDIAERRLPQDGHIKMKFPDKTIDLRVSTLPTVFGEKVVMRILDKSALALNLEKLGFEERDLKVFREAIHKPYGLILVTGPTGSGKTTTLYSAIQELNTPKVNIMTAEDPVEYDFEGVNQVQVKEEIGLTFASALRSFLRQDPDIILVGEIRDEETVKIAIRAALTGHLVMSTLHTNDAPSAVTRLLDMGVEPYLLADSLLLVLAQRLVRLICKECKKEVPVNPEILIRLGVPEEEAHKMRGYKGEGCRQCRGTGYRGRMGIFEIMPVTSAIKDLILKRAAHQRIKEVAVEEGMMTLRQAALKKFKEGLTTLDEVVRVTMEG
jgi:type IV pilus assembly protein PilB